MFWIFGSQLRERGGGRGLNRRQEKERIISFLAYTFWGVSSTLHGILGWRTGTLHAYKCLGTFKDELRVSFMKLDVTAQQPGPGILIYACYTYRSTVWEISGLHPPRHLLVRRDKVDTLFLGVFCGRRVSNFTGRDDELGTKEVISSLSLSLELVLMYDRRTHAFRVPSCCAPRCTQSRSCLPHGWQRRTCGTPRYPSR